MVSFTGLVSFLVFIGHYSCQYMHVANFQVANWSPKSDLYIYHSPISAKINYKEAIPDNYGLFDVISTYLGIHSKGKIWTGLWNGNFLSNVKNIYVIYTPENLIKSDKKFVLNDVDLLNFSSYSVHFHDELTTSNNEDSSEVTINIYCVKKGNVQKFSKELTNLHGKNYFLFVVQHKEHGKDVFIQNDVNTYFNNEAVSCFPFVFQKSSSNIKNDVDSFSENCDKLRTYYNTEQYYPKVTCENTAVGLLKEQLNLQQKMVTGNAALHNLNTYLVYDSNYSAVFLIQYGTVIVLIFALVACFTLLFTIDPSNDITLYKPAVSGRPKVD